MLRERESERERERERERGTLIFPFIHRLGPFLGVQNFEFQYFWGFREMNIFGNMKIMWISFWVITKTQKILSPQKWSEPTYV